MQNKYQFELKFDESKKNLDIWSKEEYCHRIFENLSFGLVVAFLVWQSPQHLPFTTFSSRGL
jgi:hypothetical protein